MLTHMFNQTKELVCFHFSKRLHRHMCVCAKTT